MHFSALKHCLGHFWAPPLMKKGLRGFLARSWAHKVHTCRNPKHANMEIGEFGAGRPDFGGRRPKGEALASPPKRATQNLRD